MLHCTDREREEVEGPLVAVDGLGLAGRIDGDDLGEVELPVGGVAQHLVDRGDHRGVHDELPGFG